MTIVNLAVGLPVDLILTCGTLPMSMPNGNENHSAVPIYVSKSLVDRSPTHNMYNIITKTVFAPGNPSRRVYPGNRYGQERKMFPRPSLQPVGDGGVSYLGQWATSSSAPRSIAELAGSLERLSDLRGEQ